MKSNKLASSQGYYSKNTTLSMKKHRLQTEEKEQIHYNLSKVKFMVAFTALRQLILVLLLLQKEMHDG